MCLFVCPSLQNTRRSKGKHPTLSSEADDERSSLSTRPAAATTPSPTRPPSRHTQRSTRSNLSTASANDNDSTTTAAATPQHNPRQLRTDHPPLVPPALPTVHSHHSRCEFCLWYGADCAFGMLWSELRGGEEEDARAGIGFGRCCC